jgi:head-tail adaptor
MHPGKRPYRAVFSVPKDEMDAIGNASRELVELGRAWVSIEPLTAYARERFSAAGEVGEVTHKLTAATPAFAIPQDAVATVSERAFEVKAVLDAPKSAEITLICLEKRR